MDGPHGISSLVIHTIRWTGREIVLDASGSSTAGVCPTCGMASQYVHDRYRRQPRDLPWRGHRVRLHLAVRRFRCLNGAGRRRTFAESFDPVLWRYAHFTADAEAALLNYGRTAGGEVGVRRSLDPKTGLRNCHADLSVEIWAASVAVQVSPTRRNGSGQLVRADRYHALSVKECPAVLPALMPAYALPPRCSDPHLAPFAAEP